MTLDYIITCKVKMLSQAVTQTTTATPFHRINEFSKCHHACLLLFGNIVHGCGVPNRLRALFYKLLSKHFLSVWRILATDEANTRINVKFFLTFEILKGHDYCTFTKFSKNI